VSKELSKKELAYRLDKLVSWYVRHSEKKCFTCGKRLPLAKRQAGHYIPRGVQFLRWNLGNVHVQCAKCNVALGGNIEQYRKHLDPNTRQILDECYERYKHGKLPEMNLTEMKIWYNVLCSLANSPKWQKL